MSLAVKLKKLRLKKGKSLQDVASAIGVSKSHIWGLENGKTKNPSCELLKKLADFFDLPVSNLIGENPNAPDEDPKLVKIYRNLKELSEDDRETIKLLIEGLITRARARKNKLRIYGSSRHNVEWSDR